MNAISTRHGYRTALLIVRTACFLTLAGYSIKHFTFNGRLITQIYSEPFIEWCLRLFHLKWQGFFIESKVNPRYLAFIYTLGSLFAIGSLTAFIAVPVRISKKKLLVSVVFLTSAFLILLSALSALIRSQLHLNMLLEYSIQITTALLFLWYALKDSSNAPPVRIIKWALACTFIGHGLYAMNVIPIPANFLMMTSSILHTGRTSILSFLFVAGALDVICSILLFYRRTEKYALAYMVFWGFATALARLVAYYGTASTPTWLAMWLPEFLLRSGHFLLPLYLMVIVQSRQSLKGITQSTN